jgi:hypothetical protein
MTSIASLWGKKEINHNFQHLKYVNAFKNYSQEIMHLFQIVTMNKMKIEIHQSIPICDPHLDHVWSNTSYKQCTLRTIEFF